MEDRILEQKIHLATHQMQQGLVDPAIETLRSALVLDPDYGEAHALLAICLVDAKRLHAARHEAGLALLHEPEAFLSRYAEVQVLVARRKLRQAEERLEELQRLHPERSTLHQIAARLHGLRGRRQQQREALEEALRLDPEDPDILVDLGEALLEQGRAPEAELRAREALRLEPGHADALVLMGHLHLRRGELDEAREHAVQALHHGLHQGGALHLLAAVKARRNPLLGLWWRYSVWMVAQGETRAILILLGAFLVYRVAGAAAQNAGSDPLTQAINLIWLALVAYTWIGPAWFQNMLKKELGQVRLDEGF